MTEQTTGIILRVHPLTETSLVVRWLTADLGRVATAAKGALRPKSPFRGKLDLFYEGELTFQRNRRSDLHNLREFEVGHTHAYLRRNLPALRQASYCAALLEQSSESDTPAPELFLLLQDLLAHLSRTSPAPRTVLGFELKLLAQLGLDASQQTASLPAPVREGIRVLERCSWEEIALLELSALHVRELRKFVDAFLVYHLGKLPALRDEALQQSR